MDIKNENDQIQLLAGEKKVIIAIWADDRKYKIKGIVDTSIHVYLFIIEDEDTEDLQDNQKT